MTTQYQYVETQYWTDVARLDRLEGRKLDALEADRKASFTSYQTGPYRDSLKATLRARWIAVKGSEEGFETWATKPGETPAPPAPPAVSVSAANTTLGWTKLNKPLPDFEMQEAEGKTWRLADLKGKITLINVWATWCGPCRAELPYLQKLFNRVRERKDLIVLALSTDNDVGLIVPFLEENHYTFPVFAADAYVRKVGLLQSIPRN